ncbi:MAG: histidinol dehydrogenase [Candidatus Desulfofervidaceae bacterium]|nr:histidinol dehydrogenase [Candidatus Desulfofervidaceae bacterium]
MNIVKLKDKRQLEEFKEKWQQRGVIPVEILKTVLQILADVKEKKDKAIIDYTLRFDAIDLRQVGMEIPKEEMEKAYAESREIVPVLEEAARRVATFHAKGLPQNWFTTDGYGNVLGQKITAVDKVGVYCPGGKAAYPSTVLMNVIAARVAGVKEVIMCVPTPRGEICPAVLAAAKIAGADRVFRIGGAQAIAAMAYGTETVPKVDFICGPGNIYVAAAKKLVFGEVGIDMIAGPSEIAIVADGTVSPAWCAADLLSQAEHDEMASSILITLSEDYAQMVLKEIEIQLNTLPRGSIAKVALEKQGVVFIVPDLKTAVEVANTIAPEHLELLVADPFALLDRINHAGAIFLGQFASEPIGDYIAGPNHTLPTGGTARFSSVLSAETFLKRSSVLYISPMGVKVLGEKAAKLAYTEGLTAHAASVEQRLKGDKS